MAVGGLLKFIFNNFIKKGNYDFLKIRERSTRELFMCCYATPNVLEDMVLRGVVNS